MLKFIKENVIDYILKQIPEFKGTWLEHLEFWADDPEGSTIGLDIDCLVGFSLNMIKENNTILIIRIFQTIENILNNCDKELGSVKLSKLRECKLMVA